MKAFFKYICIFCITICCFLIFLTLSCSIPSSLMKENLIDSSQTLNSEGNIHEVNLASLYTIHFDNYTDALMLNTCYSIDYTKPFYSALVARKNYIPSLTQFVYPDSVGELSSASKYEKLDQVGELKDTLDNNITESFMYARYWHGYLIFLRPLLCLFNLSTLRIIFTILLIILLLYLCFLIYKKINKSLSLFITLFFILFNYLFFGLSIQGLIVIIITMVFSILILKKELKIESNLPYIFFFVGMLTSFFDLLTTPILTLAFPMLIFYFTKHKYQPDTKLSTILIILFKFCITWFLGYSMTWAIKWFLVDCLYNTNLIITALSQINYRINGSIENNNHFSPILAVFINVCYACIPFFITICFIFLIYIKNIFYKFIKKDTSKFVFEYTSCIPYVFIGSLPIIWQAILASHSSLHFMFAYRSLIVTFICIIITFYQLFFIKTEKT